ncbi:ATP-dependent DNA helicase, partial [Caligus rogercresseyi]
SGNLSAKSSLLTWPVICGFLKGKCMAGVKVEVGGNNTVTPNVIYWEVLDAT